MRNPDFGAENGAIRTRSDAFFCIEMGPGTRFPIRTSVTRNPVRRSRAPVPEGRLTRARFPYIGVCLAKGQEHSAPGRRDGPAIDSKEFFTLSAGQSALRRQLGRWRAEGRWGPGASREACRPEGHRGRQPGSTARTSSPSGCRRTTFSGALLSPRPPPHIAAAIRRQDFGALTSGGRRGMVQRTSRGRPGRAQCAASS